MWNAQPYDSHDIYPTIYLYHFCFLSLFSSQVILWIDTLNNSYENGLRWAPEYHINDWWEDNIGLRNVLAPSYDSKLLEPTLTNICVANGH